MKCNRCKEDTQTQHYDVDGFTGYLYEACLKEWEKLQSE